MKKLKIKSTYLEEYDITVNNYLSLDEIQYIANQALEAKTYADREDIIDLNLIACCVQNPQQLEGIDLETIRKSGLMEDIRIAIYNHTEIYDAIKFENDLNKHISAFLQSLSKSVETFSNKFPEGEELEKLLNNIPQAQEIIKNNK